MIKSGKFSLAKKICNVRVWNVVSATFLLLCFSSLNGNTCQTWKNVFYFTLKALFVLEKIKFSILDVKTLRCHQMPKIKTRNTFYSVTWEVNNSLLMKLCQFMSYYKRKKFIKKLYKNCGLKTSSRLFCVSKELSATSIGNWDFWSKVLILDMC